MTPVLLDTCPAHRSLKGLRLQRVIDARDALCRVLETNMVTACKDCGVSGGYAVTYTVGRVRYAQYAMITASGVVEHDKQLGIELGKVSG